MLYLEVVWVQLDPWQYQAGPANTLGANEISACDGVRVRNFCQRLPFAIGANRNSACDGMRVGHFYRLLGFNIVLDTIKFVSTVQVARVTECV